MLIYCFALDKYNYFVFNVQIRNKPMTQQSEHDPGKEMCLRLNT